MSHHGHRSNYLVTGGAGYLGSHLVQELVRLNHNVVVLDEFSGKVKIDNLLGASYVEGSIVDRSSFEALKPNAPFDGVFHLAAKKSVSESLRNPKECHLVNVLGTQNLIEFCGKASIGKIVFTSSAAVYGSSESSEKINELSRINPINPYGESKVRAEEKIDEASLDGIFRSVNLRSFNLAGAKDYRFFDVSGENVLPIMMKCLMNKEEFQILGGNFSTLDGTCVRDYINVYDVAIAHIKAMEYLERNLSVRLNTFNVSSGQGTSILELIEYISKLSTHKLRWKISAARRGDPGSSIGDNSRAVGNLHWEPSKSMEVTIRETLLSTGLL